MGRGAECGPRACQSAAGIGVPSARRAVERAVVTQKTHTRGMHVLVRRPPAMLFCLALAPPAHARLLVQREPKERRTEDDVAGRFG